MYQRILDIARLLEKKSAINPLPGTVGSQPTLSRMYYWRSTSQFEVDLILGEHWAIEIKGATSITDKHLKGIRALKEEGNIQHFAVVSLDQNERKTWDGQAKLQGIRESAEERLFWPGPAPFLTLDNH